MATIDDEDAEFEENDRIAKDLVGAVINDRYRILEWLGSGAAAAVFKVEHVRTEARSALKLLHPGHASVSKNRKRFAREARTANAIRVVGTDEQHPGVPQVTDADTVSAVSHGDALRRQYIVMPFLQGETLESALEKRETFEAGYTLRVAIQILDALEAAHVCNIVHRDVKPSNLFLEGGTHKKVPKVRVLDFGIATMHAVESKWNLSKSTTKRLTEEGAMIGTPGYSAPEQLAGLHERVGPRSDVWSVGATMYHMLTGSEPHATAGDRMRRLIYEPVEPISTICDRLPNFVGSIVDRALAFNLDERWDSAAAMKAACEDALERWTRHGKRTKKLFGEAERPVFPVAKNAGSPHQLTVEQPPARSAPTLDDEPSSHTRVGSVADGAVAVANSTGSLKRAQSAMITQEVDPKTLTSKQRWSEASRVNTPPTVRSPADQDKGKSTLMIAGVCVVGVLLVVGAWQLFAHEESVPSETRGGGGESPAGDDGDGLSDREIETIPAFSSEPQPQGDATHLEPEPTPLSSAPNILPTEPECRATCVDDLKRHTKASCRDGKCFPRCAGGYGNCDAVLSNGCEAEFATDDNNCGGCRNVCKTPYDHTVASCEGGECFAHCEPPFSNCDGSWSNGCEVNKTTDPDHCGKCNRRCADAANAVRRCRSGTRCGFDCRHGFMNCDKDDASGCETNVSSNPANCGRCAKACSAGRNASAVCTDGVCGVDCDAGFGDCDADTTNGCETNTKVDPVHCGQCGSGCTSDQTCISGSCVDPEPTPLVEPSTPDQPTEGVDAG